MQSTVEACSDLGIEFLTLYAFSSENWKRPKAEVKALMSLLERFLKEKTDEMHEKNVRLQAIGRLNDLPEKCTIALRDAIEKTSQNSGVTLILALSYGAREEIIDGIKSVVRHVQEGHLDVGMLDPDSFSKHLYTRYYPDPDLLIRTSGEMRLSNFLLWQLSYTEMVILAKVLAQISPNRIWPMLSKPTTIANAATVSSRCPNHHHSRSSSSIRTPTSSTGRTSTCAHRRRKSSA